MLELNGRPYLEAFKEKYTIRVRAGVLEHINRIGRAFGLFSWAIMRTFETGGWVYRGQPLTHDYIAKDIGGGATRNQVRGWLRKLEQGKYIKIERVGNGFKIFVYKQSTFCDAGTIDQGGENEHLGGENEHLGGENEHLGGENEHLRSGNTAPQADIQERPYRKELKEKNRGPLNPDRWRDVCIELKGESIGEHWLLQWMTQCRGDTTRMGMLKQLLGASRADMYTVARRAMLAWLERKDNGLSVNAMFALERMVDDLIHLEVAGRPEVSG